MASEILQRMEKVLADAVASPRIKVLAELQGIADSDPKNPAPYLAMVVVGGIARRNQEDSKKYLQAAGTRLKSGTGNRDAEWEFSENLYLALQNEYKLLDKREQGGEITDQEREMRIKLANESHEALTKMGQLLRRVPGAMLPGIIYACLRTLSLYSQTGGREYSLGRDALSRSFNGSDKLRDLAGFFLMYSYRKKKDYTQAIRVGKILVQRNPRSALANMTLGSAYLFKRNFTEAEECYKKTIALAPDDPAGYLGYSNVFNRMGKLDKAKEMLEKAKSLDRKNVLTPVIMNVENVLRLNERFKTVTRIIGWG